MEKGEALRASWAPRSARRGLDGCAAPQFPYATTLPQQKNTPCDCAADSALAGKGNQPCYVQTVDWTRLLSMTRLRELHGGATSLRAAAELRQEFERDFGRVVFSTPFRRLQDKTQVFPLEPNDSVRTRLTHSLEVSSVARTLGNQVEQWLGGRGAISSLPHSTLGTLTATAALIHDLGNPPFGHAGELAIQTWFASRLGADKDFEARFGSSSFPQQCHQDFAKFEGNAQTLRILGKLQLLTDYHGLNLTAATFSVATKYVSASHETSDAAQQTKKPGFFSSESQLVEMVRAETTTGASRHPLTYLVEAADDIVYSVVDIEDGIRKGLVSWSVVEERLKEKADGPDLVAALNGVDGIMGRAVPEILIGRTDECSAQAFRTMAMVQGVRAVCDAFSENYENILAGKYQGELVSDSSYASIVHHCKALARERVYVGQTTLQLELMGRKIIHDLMDVFWSAASVDQPKKFEKKIWELMSPNYRLVFQKALQEGPLPKDYYRLQLVTDCVCGMTDSFAKDLHKSLFNSSLR